MSSSATGVGMPICFLGAILLILTQKSSQKFGDVLGIFYFCTRKQVQTNWLTGVKEKATLRWYRYSAIVFYWKNEP